MVENKDKLIELHEITIAELCLWIMQMTDWPELSPVKDGLPDILHDSINRAWEREYGRLD
jgi:hypothetical protein